MPNQELYNLLLRAIEQERRREFVGPEPATLTRRLDPNFRQLSSAPFVHHADLGSKPLQQPDGEYGAWSMPGGAATPMLAGLRDVIRRLPFAPPPSSDPSSTAPPPGAAELWKVIRPLWEMFRRSRPWSYGSGDDEYSQCLRAANAGTTEWEEFCRSLGLRQNNTVGGETQKRACWAKTYEPTQEKKNWCENQFGNN